LIHFYKSKEGLDEFENRNSWKWQGQQNLLHSSSDSSAPSSLNNDTNTITRTTTYDGKTGGFVTSVSTKISDRDITIEDIAATDDNSEADNDDLDEKLILSHKTYNTLNKREKKAVKFTNSGTKASGKMYTKTSDSGLVSYSPDYVQSIEVVNKKGGLVKLGQSDNATNEHDDAKSSNDDSSDDYHVMTNAKYVANISFNKSNDRKTSNSGDSLVTNSLLGFTAPAVSSGRKRRDDEEKAQLSGYILDEGSHQNSFEPRSNHYQHQKREQNYHSNHKPGNNEIFPGSILENNDELTNLYKTISRKQILSKVQCSSFNMNNSQLPRSSLPSSSRPLAKILSMLHSVPQTNNMNSSNSMNNLNNNNNNENMYTSIAEDSVYQSLPPTQSQTSSNNKSNESSELNNNINNDLEDVKACPVLLANIVATHSETFRHAYETGCEDCYDYSNSVGYALPYLLQNSPLQSNTCKVHKTSRPFSFPHADPERGHGLGNYVKPRDKRRNARVVCYLTGILLAFLVLIGVIVVLTLMVANTEFGLIKQVDF